MNRSMSKSAMSRWHELCASIRQGTGNLSNGCKGSAARLPGHRPKCSGYPALKNLFVLVRREVAGRARQSSSWERCWRSTDARSSSRPLWRASVPLQASKAGSPRSGSLSDGHVRPVFIILPDEAEFDMPQAEEPL